MQWQRLVTEGHFIYGLPQSSVINRLTTLIWEEIVRNQNVVFVNIHQTTAKMMYNYCDRFKIEDSVITVMNIGSRRETRLMVDNVD